MALRVQHRGDFRRVAEQRADFLLRAAQRVMFQRAGKRKQKQQRRAFRPRADAGGARGDGKHQKMHVNRALLQPFPDFLRRIKTAREVSRDINDNGQRGTGSAKEKSGQPENAAQNRGGQLRFPFVDFPDVFDEIQRRAGRLWATACRASARISARSDR